MQSVPANPWNDLAVVGATDATTAGWVYDQDTGDIYIAISSLNPAVAKEQEVIDKLTAAGAVAP